jgi:signal transduction histidine kinase
MKSFNRLFVAVIVLLIVIFAVANLLIDNAPVTSGRQYRVEVNRVAYEIEQNGTDSVDLSEYECVTAIVAQESSNDFFESESDYVIREIDGRLYRIEYTTKSGSRNTKAVMNICFAAVFLTVIIILFYIRQKIIAPFSRLRDVPYELSRGNLTVPLKENQGRFFGKFVWGMDLLRENLEKTKQSELELQKEKKTLLLSLSHDIKTPLSAIKLYAAALSKGIYSGKQKQLEIADSINKKADEIESFVSEIVKASNEDFLHLEVNITEFYLSQAVNCILDYYTEKLSLIGTDFFVGEYSDCILSGDLNRLTEVLQNIIENAVKYGDGRNISITFSEEEDCKLICVRNSGCTLSENELPHIFDSFWRGSNTGSQAGSGLGLYICRQIMHKSDGEIFAEILDGDMIVTVVVREAG